LIGSTLVLVAPNNALLKERFRAVTSE